MFSSKSRRTPSKTFTRPVNSLHVRRRTLRIESLETRVLLSVAPSIAGDGAHFIGDAAADNLYLRANGVNNLEYSTDGITYSDDMGGGSHFGLSGSPNPIHVDLGSGTNLLATDASLTTALL